MGNSAKAIVLAEDECHQNLAYAWLRERGLRQRDIRMVPLPAGGSGEQWVRDYYPDQLEAIRERRSRMKCWLYVLTDADARSVDERLQTLPAADRDPVTRLVPRRNVETWIEALTSQGTVDEVTDYKGRHPNPSSGTEAGKRLAEVHEPVDSWPSSLKRGHSELQRSRTESGLF
jgi:hypothetical protein